MPPESLLLAALAAAPRRYRMPPLPADLQAARTADTDTALAFAIEAARRAQEAGQAPDDDLQGLFTSALAALIAAALDPDTGDAAFQALVLRSHDVHVDEHVRLSAQQVVDRRAVRTALDAFAHPGKLGARPEGAVPEMLAGLHALAQASAWTELESALRAALPRIGDDAPLRDAIAQLADHAALQRLVRAQALLEREAVQQYLALCERRGPLAGSDAAAAQGRAAARAGGDAEESTVQAFRAIAQLLQAGAPAGAAFHVVASLRTPRGFPGEPGKAKDEWDVAILRGGKDGGGAAIVLLAEVKAAPAAATPDYARLLRGLQRLALAEPQQAYAFPSAQGEWRIAGHALRALQPQGPALPPQVVYCSSAAPQAQVQMLSAASKAVLLAEPASLAHAQALLQGGAPGADALAPVWQALGQAPQLRSALNQYATSVAVREAMLHPQDLLAAVRARVAA